MWKIENGIDSGDMYEYETWTVTDGIKSFKCDCEEDAQWLLNFINNFSWKECKTQRPPVDVPVYAFGEKHGNRTDKADDNIDICTWDGNSWWEDSGTEV